jgi:hypothetical protein
MIIRHQISYKFHTQNSHHLDAIFSISASKVKGSGIAFSLRAGYGGEYLELRGMKYQKDGENSLMRSCITSTPQ